MLAKADGVALTLNDRIENVGSKPETQEMQHEMCHLLITRCLTIGVQVMGMPLVGSRLQLSHINVYVSLPLPSPELSSK